MANPPGVHLEQSHASSSFNGPNHNNTNSVIERTGACMKHNPGISSEWTAEEHAILEDGLRKYTSDANLIRYAKIATQLQNKTVRDVALRCRWMALRFVKKENSKRRKEDLTRKSKDKKERVIDSSANSAYFTVQPSVPPYATPMIPTGCDDGMSCGAIGGSMGQMLEQNAQVIHQISANLESLQIQDNINLFCQTRDNIVRMLNDISILDDFNSIWHCTCGAYVRCTVHMIDLCSLNDMPEKMRQMPPLPVRINEELANTILPLQNYRRQL
ncbi:hypothetical protein JRO89_XS03G0023700 [Xanthoceras sorbifolium]|uniref:Myb-like domain-containing protein n=1 Tax=Xanthoceras sorbifolium TaxID=99658 RepID=A0ABQ8I896_9ROSI|nr:hypothetical protein JRO89_XS03G0023700 [Xanthoceras sorbifolium]